MFHKMSIGFQKLFWQTREQTMIGHRMNRFFVLGYFMLTVSMISSSCKLRIILRSFFVNQQIFQLYDLLKDSSLTIF